MLRRRPGNKLRQTKSLTTGSTKTKVETNNILGGTKMFKLAKNFKNDESGAVTVDWVVLTAAIVGLGIAVLAAVSDGVENLSGDIDTQLSGQGVSTTF
jgi:Flp pilus assembly pilin Flp